MVLHLTKADMWHVQFESIAALTEMNTLPTLVLISPVCICMVHANSTHIYICPIQLLHDASLMCMMPCNSIYCMAAVSWSNIRAQYAVDVHTCTNTHMQLWISHNEDANSLLRMTKCWQYRRFTESRRPHPPLIYLHKTYNQAIKTAQTWPVYYGLTLHTPVLYYFNLNLTNFIQYPRHLTGYQCQPTTSTARLIFSKRTKTALTLLKVDINDVEKLNTINVSCYFFLISRNLWTNQGSYVAITCVTSRWAIIVVPGSS
jgi:hypothetical protein